MKDLRRQHKAAQQSKASMDEGFPFMLTEARRVKHTAIVDNKSVKNQIFKLEKLHCVYYNKCYFPNRHQMSKEIPLE